MLLEHALLVHGAVVAADTVCWGWPARRVLKKKSKVANTFEARFEFKTDLELKKYILGI